MRLNYTIQQVGKYKFKVLRIGLFKVEWCLFNKKFLWRLEINNWDK
jgi:hypothetical protein